MPTEQKLSHRILAFVSLVILWMAFVFVVQKLHDKLLLGSFIDMAEWKRIAVFVIPGFVLVGTTIGLLERFLGARGRVIGLIGRSLSSIIPNFSESLLNLEKWHSKDASQALLEEYCEGLGERERAVFSRKRPFSQWMVADIVRNYENNVQGLAYIGAAGLIAIIGLRGVQILTKENPFWIILALELEFTLIGFLGLLIFYKPEEHKNHRSAGNVSGLDEKMVRENASLKKTLHDVKQIVDS
jgi:hypothetical protein